MRDDRPGRRRRRAALIVIAMSLVALVATSPAQIESRLEASVAGGGEMTAEAPRSTGRIALTLTEQALPELARPLQRLSGEVVFSAPTISEGHVAMEVLPVGVEATATADDGRSWPLDQLCALAEPCQREFDVTLTWLDPRPATTARASFNATVEVVYDEVETLPVGAAATWQTTAPFAPVAIEGAITAATESEQLVLDDEHPAAMRHVALTASSEARAALLSAFLETAVTQATAADVRVSVLSDGADPEEDPSHPTVLDPLDPFAGCPRGEGDCTTGVTVLFELAASKRATVAVVEWSLHASAVFPDDGDLPAGAELTAAVDAEVDWGPDDATISDDGTGSFDARSTQTIEIVANAAAMDAVALAGVRPQLVAILTVDGAPQLEVYVDGDPLVPIPGGEGTFHLRADGESAVLYPMRHCDPGAECVGPIRLSVLQRTVPTPEPGAEPLMVDWSVDLVLSYPGDDPPEDANLRIREGR